MAYVCFYIVQFDHRAIICQAKDYFFSCSNLSIRVLTLDFYTYIVFTNSSAIYCKAFKRGR